MDVFVVYNACRIHLVINKLPTSPLPLAKVSITRHSIDTTIIFRTSIILVMHSLSLITLVIAAAVAAVARPACADHQVTVQTPATSFASRLDLSDLSHDAIAMSSCWKACFQEKIDCPDTMHRKKLGECYTCCLDD
ncbi:hypothetical protein HGRIS_001624 [Hohenbuehelia grisea]|uniref:Uncharacterized protein n=1 Tax=Hohenbuehelia grisea TaxID=104357 RepID=A0ABR3JJP9_9AGAR